MADERIDLTDMLMDVASRKKEQIESTDEGSDENKQATKEFIECVKAYRDLQRDGDDFYLEQKKLEADKENKKADRELEAARVDNEEKTNRKSEEQKDRFDKFRLIFEGATVVLTGVGLVMSFATLREYQEINLNTVITNKDAVKAADNVFNSIFRRIG